MNLQKLWPHQRIFLAFILSCAILLGSQLVPWLSLWNSDQSPEQAKADNTKSLENRTILVWHWPWGLKYDDDVCKSRTGVSNCIMTNDRSQFNDADLVLFHNWELVHGNERLPVDLKRPEKQRWVWVTMEPPMYNGNLKPFAGLFNWTMTYHRDSDIYSPYGFIKPKKTASNEPVENFIPKDKTHLACWVVGNVKPELERTILYEKLKNVIPIEVYGKSNPDKKLDPDMLLPTISHCYFYLAFENSIFRDYITEKLWNNAYNSGAVPVVLGPPREQYEAVTHKDSFIHVNDFKSVEELGEFLKKVAQDKERYASYFNWRLKYDPQTTLWVDLACEFCSKMSSTLPHKVYEDLDVWQR